MNDEERGQPDFPVRMPGARSSSSVSSAAGPRRITMLKLIIFYGGVFLFIAVTMFVWLVFPPKLAVVAVADESERLIRCRLRLKRSRKPTLLKQISLPRELAESLGVSPPFGFAETETKPTSKRHAAYLEKISLETVSWSGAVTIPPKQDMILSIPASHPKSGGTLHFHHEIRGLAGFLYQREDIKIESDKSISA